MALNLPRQVWVYAERLYVHAHGVGEFKALLQRHDIEYSRDPHPFDGTTKVSYTFMSEDDYTFADFMERIPTYKYLDVLAEILFDTKVEATQADGWNYYGEFINEWYGALKKLLVVANVQIDIAAETLSPPEEDEDDSDATDFFKYSFNDLFLDYHCKELNEAHAGGLYLATLFVGRKILESVTIRVMEVVFHKLPGGQYNPDRHALWYDVGKNRYKDFDVLLTNLKAHKGEFREDADLVAEFCDRCKPLKDAANDHVHRDYKIPDESFINSWKVPQTLGLARKIYKKYCNP